MTAVAGTRPSSLARRVHRAALVLAALSAFVAGCWLDAAPALAQQGGMLRFPTRPATKPPVNPPRRQTDKAPMLLQAIEIVYDYTNKRVSAVGDVQIYYAGTTVEADKVTYDEVTKRMMAEGNVRMTEPDGRITYGQQMFMSDDFRDGFVDSLRVDTPDRTRMAAARAERAAGNYTIFHSGVYTACEACKDDPRKPPLWQIKAARMVHNEGEKMIYFENAQLEFFGRPIAYFPYFSAPDPTVKRKTGYLLPVFSYSSKYGVGVEIPYYWALAPDYDLTFSPRLMTKQGVLVKGEWRQRLINGSYSIRASGLYQLDADYFLRNGGPATPGYRDWRGAIETSGQFALNQKWVWGWDGVLPSDPTYFQDYGLATYQRNLDQLKTGLTEGISQLYISGRGSRSYFDARSIYYYGFSEADVQNQIPIIHPVVDYNYTFANPILGGELGYRINLTSLTRIGSAFDPITQTAQANNFCAPATADPAVKIPANCLLRGVPGTYSRVSAETTWRRSITDPLGQVFTPFASLRADAAAYSIQPQAGVNNYIAPGDSSTLRAMPTVGVEYRYPFINVQSWGTQTVEPIAQLIVRPNEQRIGSMPNEDFAEPDLRRQQSVPGRQVRGLGPHGGRRPGQRRIPIHRPVQPRRLRQRPVRPVLPAVRHELVRGRRHRQHRPWQRSRYLALRLRGAAVLPARPNLHVHHPLSLRPGDLCDAPLRGRRARELRPLVHRHAVRPLRCAAADRIPGQATGHPRQHLVQDQHELGADRGGPLRRGRGQMGPDPVRRRVHRRLLHPRAQLHYELHLQRQSDPRSARDAAVQPAHPRRHGVQPDCRQHPDGPIIGAVRGRMPPWRAANRAELAASAPLPKFVIRCSTLSHELRKQRGTGKSMNLVPLSI